MAARGINFDNTEIAFKARSSLALHKARWLFKSFDFKTLVSTGPKLLNAALALRLPIKPLIKATIFEQFCGGETIEGCRSTIDELARFGVGSILDYSVEGSESEADFDACCAELLRVIAAAKSDPHVRFAVFKVTGIGRFDLLSRYQTGEVLTKAEQEELARVKQRMRRLCQAAHDEGVRILVDAEETWIQDALDAMTLEMMREYNRVRPIVYNTVQMYRVDRLSYLQELHARAASEGFYIGVKLVRGAYMEKERARAAELHYPSPIQIDKKATDRDFDLALEYCVRHYDRIHLCCGTHNESSNRWLLQLMTEAKIANHDERIEFAQLLGMSDNQSYNLAHHRYHVSKYVPYGPVQAVLPYLFRRAQENSSIQGQAGRELQLIERELRRRRGLS